MMASRVPMATTVAALTALVLGVVALALLLARPQAAGAATQGRGGGGRAGLVLGVVALALWLARPQATAASTTSGAVRQITVVGSGDVKVAPDTAQVQVGVQTQAPTAREALSQNTAQMEALLARLRESGIE